MPQKQRLDIPSDVHGHPVQVSGFTGEPTNLSVGPLTAATVLPANVQGGWVVRLAATTDCYIEFGDNTVQADSDSILFPQGVEYVKVPEGATYIACIQVSATGILSIVNVE